MNFVDFVLIAIHISLHMYLKFFANFTHYTSYSLLNIVHVIVFLGLTNQVCNYFEFLCKTYFVFENVKGESLKILILGKLGLILVFWKSISSHIHAFYPLYSML